MRRLVLVLVLAALLTACGSANVVSPNEVAQNYLYAIAEGDFPGACALLERHTREALVSLTRSRGSCPTLFARCLPKGSTTLRRDQVQLLYANVELSVQGSRAHARLSGVAVANAAHEVSLEEQHTQWRLTSAGDNIARCVRRLSRHRRRAH